LWLHYVNEYLHFHIIKPNNKISGGCKSSAALPRWARLFRLVPVSCQWQTPLLISNGRPLCLFRFLYCHYVGAPRYAEAQKDAKCNDTNFHFLHQALSFSIYDRHNMKLSRSVSDRLQ